MATPAEMVVLIDAAIEAKLTGGAVQSVGSRGTSIQHMTLSELRALRREYATLAATAAGDNGSLQIAKVTNAETSA